MISTTTSASVAAMVAVITICMPKFFEAEEISVPGSDCGPEENDPPDHARNMPFDSREAAAARLVELVPALEELGLDNRFT